MSYAVIGIEGLLIATNIISLVRMFIHGKFNEKAFKKLHEEEDRIKGKDTFTKNEFKKHQEELKEKTETKPTLTQRKRIAEKMDKDELARIKARLREEYRRGIVE
jgi:hypothetical protein